MSPTALPIQELCLIGVANPFTDNWVEAENVYLGGQGNVFESGPSRAPTWWNFNVTVLGETFTTVDPNPPVTREVSEVLCASARNSGNPHSLLKVEVIYPLGNTRIRRFRFDIGSGIDIFIPPTWQVSARILRPEIIPGGVFANPVPPGFDPNLFFISDLLVSARCAGANIVPTADSTWSNTLFVSDPGNATRDFEVEEGAVAVSASFDVLPVTPILFVWQRRDANGAVIDETTLGSANAAAASTSIERSSIPGGTNLIRYVSTVFPIEGTITQHLEF